MAFNKDFLWGVSGASAQQDGGYLDGGKGLSIWDSLSVGRVMNNDTCHTACDHYHRWREDLALLKEIGVNAYRFSVSPARLYPTDEVTVNEEGVKFYQDLVSELHRLGIEPLVTLYHWDMPLWLHHKGGWKSEIAIGWFERYTKTVVDAISDKVKYWLTFNEPQSFVYGGYEVGNQAPYEKVGKEELKVISRNVMIAHGRSVKVIRRNAKIKPQISFAPCACAIIPSPKLSEKEAYEKMFDTEVGGPWNCAWWAEPIVLGKAAKGCDWLSEDDLKEICQPLDYYGFSIYFADNAEDFAYAGIPRTAMGWSIIPESIYWASKMLYKRYGLPILITENGMANIDFVFEDGKVHDPQRTEYLRSHIRQLKRAADEGVPVIGYSCWSFLDNFEWSEGCDKRFGLVYVDYRTQKRTLKDSAYFYGETIKTNGEKL